MSQQRFARLTNGSSRARGTADHASGNLCRESEETLCSPFFRPLPSDAP
ncbi:hypothetical protein ACVJGD_007796 [Bradyrhizobium sp. USDA 10063]